MAISVSPSIDNLEATWHSLIELCAGLSEKDWKRPTGCPGWSVQDTVSHLIDYESRAMGGPAPTGDAVSRPHTKNTLGESNEVGVEYRRGRRGHEVLDELRDVTSARAAQLHDLTVEDLGHEIVTPAGPGTVADMLKLRLMDTWSHEQDIRRAVGRPGHDQGAAVEEAVTYFAQFLPIIVAKRAGAPEGALVVFEIGDLHRVAIQMVEGRARVLGDDVVVADRPTVRLTMPTTTFGALVGGRTDAPGDVVIDGDVALGSRILDVLGFMP